MTSSSSRVTTGLLLIAVPAIFLGCFTLLGMQFEYPDILRQPTADVLAKFRAGGTPLIATWYVLTLTAILFVPLSFLVESLFASETRSPLLRIATTFGVLAGVVQTLGFIRWPLLVPYLATTAGDPTRSVGEQQAAVVVFEAFHRYAGMALGEHLGYLCTSVWTVLIGLQLLRTGQFGRWLGAAGMVLAVGIGSGLAEPAGLELAGTINAISYLVWAVWLVVFGAVVLLKGGRSTVTASRESLSPLPASARS